MPKSEIAKKIISKIAEKAPSELEAAQGVLEKYGTVEAATALKGPERQAYLDALDSVYGDRATRAKGLGFGDKTYYHGTKHDKPIEQFRASGTQEGDVAKAGKGVYLSDNPQISEGYIGRSEDGGSIYPVKLKNRVGGEFEPDDLRMAKEIIQEQGLGPKGPKQKLRATEEGLHALQRTGEDPQDILRNANLRYSEGNGNIVVADPNEIRSTNAAFDPRFKDSANILALNGEKAASTAGLIVGKALKSRPDMSLGSAFGAINEPLEALNEASGRNEAVNTIGTTAGQIAARIPRAMDQMLAPIENAFSTKEQIAARAAASNPSALEQQTIPVAQMGAGMLIPATQDLAMGPMGHTLGIAAKGATAAEKAASKLEEAMAKGYKPTAAEGFALEKYRGNNMTTTAVIPTAQEAANTRNVQSMFEPSPVYTPKKP